MGTTSVDAIKPLLEVGKCYRVPNRRGSAVPFLTFYVSTRDIRSAHSIVYFCVFEYPASKYMDGGLYLWQSTYNAGEYVNLSLAEALTEDEETAFRSKLKRFSNSH